MKQRSLFLTAAIFFTLTQHAYACGEITPDEEVTKIVTRLAYPDFPKASDVFAVIRIESSYDPDAANESATESSHGLMQVQNGPFEVRQNIAQGIAKLREYYKLTHSKKGAIESYNIGPKNWLEKKLRISGEAYYDKYLLQKRVYAHYPAGNIVNLGKHLGCGKQNGIPPWLQKALLPNASDETLQFALKKIK